jgi:biotin carboxyl carrier protein
MRYFVHLDPAHPETGESPARPEPDEGKPIDVDVIDLPSGELEVRVDGRRIEVDVVVLGDQLSARIDGKVVDLTTEGTPPELGAIASGQRAYVRVESERQRAADAAKRGGHTATEKQVMSPMPGRIVKLLVQKGDVVTAGQPLLVMEAMKMENEIRSRTAGTVAEVHVTTGSTVEANSKLVSLA